MTDINALKRTLDSLSESERREIFSHLRRSILRHPVEERLMASAETILEAIARSPDLTVRGIEGIIAEAAFATEIVPALVGWTEQPVAKSDQPYDFVLADYHGAVTVQVKMQRRKERRPLRASEVNKARGWSDDYFVVETQRTRSGKGQGGAATRPYRFGQFDLLAVSMGASQGRWSAFMYTVERWLIPSKRDEGCLSTYQPIPPAPNEFWTDDFATCVSWLRSGRDGVITGGRSTGSSA